MTRRSPGGIYLANKNDRKRFKKGKKDGRYRSPHPKDQRGSAGASGDTGRDDTVDAAALAFRGVPVVTVPDLDPADLRPGGLTFIGPAPTNGQTLSDLMQKYKDDLDQQLLSTMVYGKSPARQRPDLKREMQVGEIIAYRCWRYDRGALRSVYMRDLWVPHETHVGRELEDWGERGIHAWKTPNSPEFSEYVRDYLSPGRYDPFRFHDETPTMITGSVFLWGDVVEHTYGYRAEFARVRSIDWVYPNADDMGCEAGILNQLRRLYRV